VLAVLTSRENQFHPGAWSYIFYCPMDSRICKEAKESFFVQAGMGEQPGLVSNAAISIIYAVSTWVNK
jgi:hypothetical protein